MTKLKTRLPLAIPHPLQIPTNWTPEKALPVFEIIDDLRNAIWRGYEQELLAEYHKRRRQAALSEQDLDEDPPF
jgi:hypothetical protein